MNKNNNVDQVYCTKCYDYHDVEVVETLKREEEYQGYDSLVYTCPVFKEVVSSVIHKKDTWKEIK